MTYQEVVEKVRTLFGSADVSNIREHLAYQFNITGEGAGAFYVEVRDGKMYIEPYEYHDCDATFTCTADMLLQAGCRKGRSGGIGADGQIEGGRQHRQSNAHQGIPGSPQGLMHRRKG